MCSTEFPIYEKYGCSEFEIEISNCQHTPARVNSMTSKTNKKGKRTTNHQCKNDFKMLKRKI